MSGGDFDDPLDAALGRRLRELAPASDDTDEALEALGPRALRARRRHRVTQVASIAAAVVLVTGIAAFAATSNGDTDLAPAVTTRPGPSISTDTSTTTDPGPTTTTILGGGSGTTPGTDPTNSTPTSPQTTTPTTPGTEQTYRGVGGSVWVRLDGGELTLIAATATNGFTADVVEERADRVEVRFQSDDGQRETRIRVDVDGGEMVPEIDESD